MTCYGTECWERVYETVLLDSVLGFWEFCNFPYSITYFVFYTIHSVVTVIVFLIFVTCILPPWSNTSLFQLVNCYFLQRIIEKRVSESIPDSKCTWPIALSGPTLQSFGCCSNSLWTAVSTLLLCMMFLPPRWCFLGPKKCKLLVLSTECEECTKTCAQMIKHFWSAWVTNVPALFIL